MPKTSRPTFKKRQKEMARQQKQKDKQSRRVERKEQKQRQIPLSGDVDPDIAAIRPGPQPPYDPWSEDEGGEPQDN